MQKKWLIIGITILILGAFLAWLFTASSQPLPGTKVADSGRKHVPAGEIVDYNSNPPTSGSHYEDWIRAGVYESPKDDRNLVHSLEHGYVVISYNCDKKFPVSSFHFQVSSAYAHGVEEEVEQSSEATNSGQLPDAFKSEDCHKLVDQLISIYEKKGKVRLIVVPRPELDSRIALTAWNYLDKFDPSTSSGLSVSEIERVEKFIDAHLNQGPEKTMETSGK